MSIPEENIIMQQSLLSLLRRLWQHISRRRRGQILLLFVLTLFSSIAEVISLGAVLPFIGVITQPEKIFASPWLSSIIEVLGIQTASELVLPLAICFGVAALIAGGLRLLLLWISIRLSNAIGADLSSSVYLKTLYQDYSVHLARSSSEIISGITLKVSTAIGIIMALLFVVTSAFLFTAIMVTLLAVDSIVAIIAVGSFGLVYFIIARYTRRILISNSESIAKEQVQLVKSLQEGLGAIRDVLLDGSQKTYSSIFRKAILQVHRANGENSFINQAPRFILESLGMSLVAAFVVVVSRSPEGILAALPILAVLALAAQRLLPLMQQLYGSWSTIVGSKAGLNDVLVLLEQPLPIWVDEPEPLPLVLKECITIDNVSFRYNSSTPWVFKGLNLKIFKGERVGIIGSTGSGKSTMLDLLMGLLKPNIGAILINEEFVNRGDERAWQRTVAHVPQHIFLADSSIAENIAFGIPLDQIEYSNVYKAAKKAQISDFIESRPEAYDTIVGERGVRLSGGQRQRIGIARALYRKATVLIFDEATSALDDETEQAVMQTINNLSKDLTLFIVAHRLTTLKSCSQIIELGDCGIRRIGSYKDIMNQPK